MEKVLDAGKNATYVLIGVCAALLVAAMTDEGGEGLDAPIEELRALSTLVPERMAADLNMWRTIPDDSDPGSRSSRPEIGRTTDFVEARDVAAIRSAALTSLAPVSSAVQVRYSIDGWNCVLPWVPTPEATLDELKDYLQAAAPYRLMHAGGSVVPDGIKERLGIEQPRWERVSEIIVLLRAELEQPLTPGRNYETAKLTYLDGVTELRIRPILRSDVEFKGKTVPRPEGNGRDTRDPPRLYNLPIDYIEIQDRQALIDLLANSSKHFKALVEAGADPTRLEALDVVWPEIKGMRPSEALKKLEERRLQQKQAISILGLSIQRKQAVVGGPLLLLALIFYVISHLRRARELLGRPRSGDAPVTAWQATYPDLTGRLVFLATAFLFPAGSAFAMVGVRDSLTSYLLPVLVCAAGLWAVAEGFLLRRGLLASHQPQAQERATPPAENAVPSFTRERRREES